MVYKISQIENKEQSWYILDFFDPISNIAISSSLFNAAVIGYSDIMIFWYFVFFFNNCSLFSQRFFLNFNFHVEHKRSFRHIFFCVGTKNWS